MLASSRGMGRGGVEADAGADETAAGGSAQADGINAAGEDLPGTVDFGIEEVVVAAMPFNLQAYGGAGAEGY